MNYKEELKDVIERNVDAYKVYEKAADKVSSPQMASSFRNQAAQRKMFAYDLAKNANVYENEDALKKIENGSFEGNLHRTWMDIRTALTSDKDEAILEECIRGEKEALDEYNELTREGYLPADIGQRITLQKETISQCIDDLKHLEKIAG